MRQDFRGETFEKLTNLPREEVNAECLEFYENEFNQAKIFTGENPRAKRAVKIAHQKAPMVVLATNPLFPLAGQNTRLGWLGLSKEDFDLVTSYEQDCYCKPNPKYFETICARIGVKPEECLYLRQRRGRGYSRGIIYRYGLLSCDRLPCQKGRLFMAGTARHI